MELNLVEMWLRKDPVRWIAGIFAGLFAAVVLVIVGSIFCRLGGYDGMLALRAWGVPLLGREATDYNNAAGLIMGAATLGALASVLGFAFSHFVFTNKLAPLLGMGFTWGVFGWIFMNNLMFQSWRDVYALGIPRGGALLTWISFGLALSSVAVFDRLFRGARKAPAIRLVQ